MEFAVVGADCYTRSCEAEGRGGAVTNRARRYKKRGVCGNFAAHTRRIRAARIQHAAPQPNLSQIGWSWAQMVSGLGPSKLTCTSPTMAMYPFE